MAKSIALTAPIVCIALDVWLLNPAKATARLDPHGHYQALKRLIIKSSPGLIFAFVVGLISMTTQPLAGTVNWVHRVCTPFISLSSYVTQFCWPTELCLIYIRPDYWPELTVFGSMIMVTLGTLWCWRCKPSEPLIWLGCSIFILTTLPVSGIVPFGHHWKADRYTYYNHLGLLLLVVGLARVSAPFFSRFSRMWSQLIPLVVLAAWTSKSFAYVPSFSNSLTSLSQVLSLEPEN